MNNLLSLFGLIVLCGLVSASRPACSTPGRVEAAVCTSRLCGPHGFCLAVTFGFPCNSDWDCTSQNCNSQLGVCEKAAVGTKCLSNSDCSSNNCDLSCDRCKPVHAGESCACDGDCYTRNCDSVTHTCRASASRGNCDIAGDCLSGDCHNGYCKRSQAGQACSCNGDCVTGSKCLIPTGASVGICYVSAANCCGNDAECGTGFCSSSLSSSQAVCLRGGIGAPCAADCDCQDGGDGSIYCSLPSTPGNLGTCAENLCRIQVCDINAVCSNEGPGRYSCSCNSGYTGSGLNTNNARAPGCVLPVFGVNDALSTCAQDFECGSARCLNVTCALSLEGICQSNADCQAGWWCATSAQSTSFQIGGAPNVRHGHCEINKCLVNNGGCVASATCTPKRGGDTTCKCNEAAGFFGSGELKDKERACVNPCLDNNGGCGPAIAADCVAINRRDVQCHCKSGYYLTERHGCVDPCLHDNGGCGRYEICNSFGPDSDEDVTCRCRDGFDQVGDNCVINYCYNECTGANQACEPKSNGFVCKCTVPGQIYYQGSCVADHCQDATRVCSPFAQCTFNPAGGLLGQVTGDASIDSTTSCECVFGFTGNGFVLGNGCSPATCAVANVVAIANANSGNCDGSQTTGDYCVLGCNAGFRPSTNPEAQCVGTSPGNSTIQFRPFTCKRDSSHSNDAAWSCETLMGGVTQCVPRAPSVGWKRDGRIGLHWSALGLSVSALSVKYQLADGSNVVQEKVIANNPGFATSVEITGLTQGATYAFWLSVTSNEGTSSSTFAGKALISRV